MGGGGSLCVFLYLFFVLFHLMVSPGALGWFLIHILSPAVACCAQCGDSKNKKMISVQDTTDGTEKVSGICLV